MQPQDTNLPEDPFALSKQYSNGEKPFGNTRTTRELNAFQNVCWHVHNQ